MAWEHFTRPKDGNEYDTKITIDNTEKRFEISILRTYALFKYLAKSQSPRNAGPIAQTNAKVGPYLTMAFDESDKYSRAATAAELYVRVTTSSGGLSDKRRQEFRGIIERLTNSRNPGKNNLPFTVTAFLASQLSEDLREIFSKNLRCLLVKGNSLEAQRMNFEIIRIYLTSICYNLV